jgi:hypothetical protein
MGTLFQSVNTNWLDNNVKNCYNDYVVICNLNESIKNILWKCLNIKENGMTQVALSGDFSKETKKKNRKKTWHSPQTLI